MFEHFRYKNQGFTMARLIKSTTVYFSDMANLDDVSFYDNKV